MDLILMDYCTWQFLVSLEHVLALTPLLVSLRVYRVQSWANNIWQWSQVYAVLYCCRLQFASPDFLLDWMTSHILKKSSSMLLSFQVVSSLGLVWIGNTQLSTAPVCWTERSLSVNSAQTLRDFDLVALLNTTFCETSSDFSFSARHMALRPNTKSILDDSSTSDTKRNE